MPTFTLEPIDPNATPATTWVLTDTVNAITLGGETFDAVEHSGCTLCAFRDDDRCDVAPVCSEAHRSDTRDVIWVRRDTTPTPAPTTPTPTPQPPQETALWAQLRALQVQLARQRLVSLNIRLQSAACGHLLAPVAYAVDEATGAVRYLERAHAAHTLTTVMVDHANDMLDHAESMVDACLARM